MIDKKVKTLADLQSEHQKKPTIQCKKCGKEFSDNTQLKEHTDEIHPLKI